MRSFDYFFTQIASDTLEVDDIGNCIIECCDDRGLMYYLYVQTLLGETKIVEYGPATPDFHELPNEVTCLFSRIEFNENKISQRIDKFINNTKRNITQARVIEDRETMFTNCKDILQYISDSNNF